MSDVNRDGDRSDDGVPDLRLRQMQIVAHNRHQRGDAKPSHEAKKKHPNEVDHVPLGALFASVGSLNELAVVDIHTARPRHWLAI